MTLLSTALFSSGGAFESDTSWYGNGFQLAWRYAALLCQYTCCPVKLHACWLPQFTLHHCVGILQCLLKFPCP